MSYDIDLVDPVSGERLEAEEPHQMRGGTYAMGGTRELSLNMTYNYAGILGRVLPRRPVRSDDWVDGRDDQIGGIRYIYGLTGVR